MFIKNNRRFNLNKFLDTVYVDDNGIQHPGTLLRNPAFREQHGIFEIPDPSRGNDETQYTQEIDVDPWIIITDKNPAQIAEIQTKKMINVIQNHLDNAAIEKGYDSILSASSYASFENPFQQEGIAFLQWRAACWAKGYEILEQVTNNEILIPTEEQLILQLPELVLPN